MKALTWGQKKKLKQQKKIILRQPKENTFWDGMKFNSQFIILRK